MFTGVWAKGVRLKKKNNNNLDDDNFCVPTSKINKFSSAIRFKGWKNTGLNAKLKILSINLVDLTVIVSEVYVFIRTNR